MLKAIVAYSSRKYVKVINQDNELIPGVLASKDLSTVVGDEILYDKQAEKEEVIVKKILERKNLLIRSSQNKTKELASNIDLLFIITAPRPLFNKTFIDRVLLTAAAQRIKTILVINKSDLSLEETLSDIEIYRKIGIDIIYSSTIKENGLEHLKKCLNQNLIKNTCFLGISGVGKSSIIKNLCPEQELKIDNVSLKSGQGKQTTTVAHAYRYQKLLLIDLPGIQNFGIMHLKLEELKFGFPEILEHSINCKFSNCTHQEEPGCNIKLQLQEGAIYPSRYESYLALLNELKALKNYQ